MRVLLLEDDPGVAKALRRGLEEGAFAVDVTTSGPDCLWFLDEFTYDVLVLDFDVADVDGIELCRRLRQGGQTTPLLAVSSRRGIDERVRGLDAGADDYLPKPFALSEVVARVRALSRRAPMTPADSVAVGDTVLDMGTRGATRGGASIPLTVKEFALLRVLMHQPQLVMTAEELRERAWAFAEEPRSNVVAVYVRYLRNKLDRPFGRHSIVTVRGHGYRYDPAG